MCQLKLNNCNVSSPCMNCVDRYVGCHDRCDRYCMFKSNLEAAKIEDKAKRCIYCEPPKEKHVNAIFKRGRR